MQEPLLGEGYYDFFEQAREQLKSETFPDSRIPAVRDVLAVILVDGFNTSSDTNLVEVYKRAHPSTPVCAYSYVGVGLPYPPSITRLQPLRTSAERLIPYLPTKRRFTVVPVGLSAGAVITVLGVAEWIRRAPGPQSALAAWVPKIILVAPALTPDPDVYMAYLRHAGDEESPIAVEQLCNQDSRYWTQTQLDLAEALGVIAWAQIPIVVIHWPGDILTPFPWLGGLRNIGQVVTQAVSITPPGIHLQLKPSPIDNDYTAKYKEYQESAANTHVRFLRHDWVVQEVFRQLPYQRQETPLITDI